MIDKRKFIFIVGETARGKDTLANILKCKGLKPVCSFTTRPKRKNERNGIEHFFVNTTYAHKVLDKLNEEIVAYTKIGEYEYFATLEEVKNSDFYIIDPNGIKYIKNGFPELFENSLTVYITCSDEISLVRALKRGDDINVYNERLKAEKEQFKEFKENITDDVLVFKNNGDMCRLDAFSNKILFCAKYER